RHEKTGFAHAEKIAAATNYLYHDSNDNIESEIIGKEDEAMRIKMLADALKDLSLRQQEVIQLRFYQGFKNEQIAELMGMNYQSVSNLLGRALLRLREKIEASAILFMIFGFCLVL